MQTEFDFKRKRKLKETADRSNESEQKISISYRPQRKQKNFADFISEGKRVVAFIGGIRSGKTYAGSYEALKQIYKYCRKPNLGWIVSPTYPMSLITERAFEEAAGNLIMKKLRGERAYIMYPNKGSNEPYRVEIKSAEYPDRLRGAGLAWIWIDEAAMITEECWKILLGRVLDTKGIIFITTTPRGHNWLYRYVWEESHKNPNYAVVKANTLDNKFLDPTDVAALRNRYSTEFARQELEAEFVNFQGLVYKGFDFSKHVVPPWTSIPKGAEVIGGIDTGYGDPFVHLWAVKYGGKIFIVDEYYQPQRTIEAHANSIKAGRFDSYIVRRWIDPRSAQEAADLTLKGIYTMQAKSGNDELEPGINEVEHWFETNRLLIASNCVETLQELAQYHYEIREDKNTGKKPVDYKNHAMDALRYIVYSEARYSMAHPYLEVDESGQIHIRGHKGDPLSNRLEDWITLPAYPVYDPDEQAVAADYDPYEDSLEDN